MTQLIHDALQDAAVFLDELPPDLGRGSLNGMRAQLRHKVNEALSTPAPSTEPDQALLISMAVCLNHGFGTLSPAQQQVLLHDMRKVLDEVQGRGYYSPTNRERYLALLNESDPCAAITEKVQKPRSGRDKSGNFEIAPRLENGVDHSASGIVLAKRDAVRLVWRYAGKYWSGREQHYAPPELEILNKHDHMPKDITDNFRNDGRERRLSRALIERHADQINSIFGDGAAKKIASLQGTIDFGKDNAR